MNRFLRLKNTLALGVLAVASQVGAQQITFYQNENYAGGSFTADRPVTDFQRYGFSDLASSVIVKSERWEVCDDVRFTGRCMVLRPGRYPSLAAMGLNNRVSSVRIIDRNARIDDGRYAVMPPVPSAQGAQMIFYEAENFHGRSFATQAAIADFTPYGFNDRTSSVVVLGDRWEACDNSRFSGNCVVLRPGRYPSLKAMGLNNKLSSVRTVATHARFTNERYAPPPMAVYDNRRRQNERLFEVNVSSVRAVLGTPGQRCWMEREAVAAPPPEPQNPANIGGAIAGALIGGILGHQVGGGSGKDLATVGGVVAGAALGANVGRNNNNQAPQQPVSSREVQRCAPQTTQTRPDYWDVGYTFRGQEHHVQMTTPPGPTITVNGKGEPRA